MQPLYLPANLHPERPRKWRESFLYDFPIIGEMARARRFLLRLHSYRNINNFVIQNYWTDNRDFIIAKKVMDIISEESQIQALLLPEDQICLITLLFDRPLDMNFACIFLELDNYFHCCVSEDFCESKTFGEFIKKIRDKVGRGGLGQAGSLILS